MLATAATATHSSVLMPSFTVTLVRTTKTTATFMNGPNTYRMPLAHFNRHYAKR